MDTVLAHAGEIASALAVLIGLIWHKKSGESTDSIRATLKAWVQGLIHDEIVDVTAPAVEAKVRTLVTEWAKKWLADHNVTGTVADLLVGEAVEIGLTELKRMITQADAIRGQLEAKFQELGDAAKKAEDDAAAAIANNPIPKLDLNIEVVPASEQPSSKPESNR